MTAGGGADPQRGWLESGQAAFAAWLPGTVFGAGELYSLAAGLQAGPGWRALSSASLLLCAGVLAAAWLRGAQDTSAPPADSGNGVAVASPSKDNGPQTVACAALITSSAGTSALLAGRMANVITGDGPLFILICSLVGTLCGALGTLALSPPSGPRPELDLGPTNRFSLATLLRRLAIAGLCLSGFFVAAWIAGAGMHRPALLLALLPALGLGIGLMPEATVRCLGAVGARIAAAARALFGGQPLEPEQRRREEVAGKDPAPSPKVPKAKKGKKNPV